MLSINENVGNRLLTGQVEEFVLDGLSVGGLVQFEVTENDIQVLEQLLSLCTITNGSLENNLFTFPAYGQ